MPTEITNYQCPSCTGPVHFDVATGKLVCDYCGGSYTPQELEALYRAENEKAAAAQTKAEAEPSAEPDPVETDWGQDAQKLRAYNCPSCGAQLLCEETTAATSCPYCGNPTVVPGKLSGTLRPDYVLPFKLDKEAAVRALTRHYKGKPLLPKAFSAQNHIREIQGVYVPFWLFDGAAEGDMTFTATRSHTRRSGDVEITTTDHFNLRRAGSMAFQRIPADGSSKMPDGHMDAIEPFRYEDMVPFSMSYLPGFLADRYDVPAETAGDRVEQRMRSSMVSALSASTAGYHTCVSVTQNVQVNRQKARYALLPVWMLHTKWQGKDYLFAMNGQTGKLVGDPPVSWGRFWAWFTGIFAGTAGLMSLLMLL